MSVSPSTSRNKKIELIARYRAQSHGGEVEQWIDKVTPIGKRFDDKRLRKAGYWCSKKYNYTNTEGHLLYQSLRYEHKYVKTEKLFVFRHEDEDVANEWLFGQGPVKVVYRWQALAAKPDDDVYFCEGEKDADRVAELGLVSTTVAGSKWSESAAEALRGRNVYYLEDNDEAGRSNSAAAFKALRYLAKSFTIVRLPGLEHKGDVSDWLDLGHTKDELIAEAKSSPRCGALPLFNVTGLDGVDVPVQLWSVPDRIPTGYTTLFSGEGAAGKSLIELQKSVAHVLNVNWLGMSVQPGPALFIDAEDATGAIHHRLNDILTHHGRKFADLKDRLHISSLLNQDTVLAAMNYKTGRIETTALYDSILEMVGDIKPVMITIASSANVFAGNELDRAQVQQFVSQLTRLAILAAGSLVLISHPSLSGIKTDTGLSGSTQWHNAVRARYYIKGVKDDEEGEPEGDVRVIQFRKSNYGRLTEEVVVKWHNGLFVPINTTVDQVAKDAEADAKYLEVLKILTDQNQDLSPAKNSPSYAATMISDHPQAPPFRKKDMEAAQQRLLNANKIHIADHGPPSRPQKRIVLGPRSRQNTETF
jgi:hypothetical protein